MDATDAPDGTAGIISNLQGWAAEPFSTQMSLSRWALFTGLIIVLSILWIFVLHETLGEI